MRNSIELNIDEMLNYCNDNYGNNKNGLTVFLSTYFLKRINAKKNYTEKEIENIEKLVEFLKCHYAEEGKTKNRMLSKARNLWLLSQDSLNGTDNYEKVYKFENNFNEGYDNADFFEYIKILLDNASCYMTLSLLENQIKNYLSKNNSFEDNNRLLDLVENHPNFYLLDCEESVKGNIIKVLRNSNSKDYIIRLNKSFYKSIKKDKICYNDISDYLRKFDEALKLKFDNQACNKVKEVINTFLDDKYAITKFYDVDDYYKVREELERFSNKLDSMRSKDSIIRGDIRSGKLILKKDFPVNIPINYKFDDLDIVRDARIIAIDDIFSPDLDTAFSIKEIEGIYVFNVYVSDVPDFLKYNRQLSEIAYERGNSIYIHEGNGRQTSIDMIPKHISHKDLSLNLGYPTNTVEFNFVIGNDGEFYSKSVSRKRIKVTDKLTPKEASVLINSNECMGNVQNDLKKYKKMSKAVIDSSTDPYLKMLKVNKISDLVGFSSVLVNYYVGHEAEFAIYRVGGKYTDKSDIDCYTHSVTPIRRFVSNINLAFFLEQNGVTNFPEKDLASIQNNKDEIISHLNETDALQPKMCIFIRKCTFFSRFKNKK